MRIYNFSFLFLHKLLLSLFEEMSCQICCISYDHSIHKPYSLTCPHTFCLSCLNQLLENKCPICTEPILSKHPNLALLEFIGLSKYDELKEQTLKSIGSINELRNNFINKQEIKKNIYLNQLNDIRQFVTKETNELINKLKENQQAILDETGLLEKDLLKDLITINDENNIKILNILNSKNGVEQNSLNELKLGQLFNEIEIVEKYLNDMDNKIDLFKEDYQFVLNECVDIKNGSIGEIKTEKKVSLSL